MSFLLDRKTDVQILIRAYEYRHTLQIRGEIETGNPQIFIPKSIKPGEHGWVGKGHRVTRPGNGPCEINITVEVERGESRNPRLQSLKSGEVRFDHFGGLDVQWLEFVDRGSGDVIVRVYLFELDEGD